MSSGEVQAVRQDDLGGVRSARRPGQARSTGRPVVRRARRCVEEQAGFPQAHAGLSTESPQDARGQLADPADFRGSGGPGREGVRLGPQSFGPLMLSEALARRGLCFA